MGECTEVGMSCNGKSCSQERLSRVGLYCEKAAYEAEHAAKFAGAWRSCNQLYKEELGVK